MKTLTKTILALSGLLLLAGCGAAAQDQTQATGPGPGFGPGWRHEQMVQAREKGEFPGPAMMRGRGFGPGYGPMMAIGADGKVDPAKMPPWCPYRTAPAADTAK